MKMRFQVKLRLNLALLSAFVILAFSFSSFYLFSHILKQDFTSKATAFISSLNVNMEIQMNYLEEIARLIADNKIVGDALASSNIDTSIVSYLDGTIMTNYNILGVSVYKTNGPNYYSSTIFSPPTEQTLESNPDFSAFLNGTSDAIWMLRRQFSDIPQSGNYTSFDSTYGILSYILKIQGKTGETIGLLIMDTQLSELIYPLQDDTSMFLKDAKVFFRDRNNGSLYAMLATETDLPRLDTPLPLPNEVRHGPNQSLLLCVKVVHSNLDMYLNLPLEYIGSQQRILILVLAILDVILLGVCWIVIRTTEDSFVGPIAKLTQTIHDYHQDNHTCR